MMIDLNAAVDLLGNQNEILILTHAHPDGDTLGSAFALKSALASQGKSVSVCCADKIPAKYAYLGEADVETDCGFTVAVDVADTKLLGKDFEPRYGNKINLCIDHHGSNRLYAEQTLLDSGAAATCEVILELIRAMGAEITPDIADCIYTGLSTDSGCFRYSNVTPRTLRMAADMIEAGANYAEINGAMFETKTRAYLELERLALESLQMLFDGRCAIVTVTQEMYRLSGSDESEVDAIASIPRQIENVLVGVTIREKRDGSFKVSMRSREPVDASEICSYLGGGGHPRAAGCQIDKPYESALEKVVQSIKLYFEKNNI